MKARIAGTELGYDVRGQGPALLLLHAFPLHLGMWDEQVRALEASHLVVRMDCRGFGGTPPSDSLLTMERIAEDAAALLDHLGVSRVTLAGLSMGGYAAFAFVRRHAERLDGLVLADTRALPDSGDQRRNRAALAERVRREGAAAAAEAVLPKLLGETSHLVRPAVVERVRAMTLAASPAGIANALAGLAARADSVSTLREVRVPTLVIRGAEDPLMPVDEAEAMAKGIAGARLVTIPKAGHLANLEAPEDFNRELLAFLRR